MQEGALASFALYNQYCPTRLTSESWSRTYYLTPSDNIVICLIL